MQRILIAAAAAASLTIAAGAAQAAEATYTISGNWSGTVNGVAFTDADFLMTLTGDTAAITDNGTAEFQDHLQTAKISIAGFGDLDILNGMGINNNTNPLSREGFIYTTTPGTFDTIGWNLQTAVDLRHSFGPVQTAFTEMLNPLDTSGGQLAWQIAVGGPTLTVTGRVEPDGVPEPDAWALMLIGFGAAGSLLRHRRRAVAAA